MLSFLVLQVLHNDENETKHEDPRTDKSSHECSEGNPPEKSAHIEFFVGTCIPDDGNQCAGDWSREKIFNRQRQRWKIGVFVHGGNTISKKRG